MATIIIPNFNTEKAVVGLNSYQYTVQAAGLHNCKIEVDHREASSLTVSVAQAGSVSATLATVTLPGVASNLPTGAFLNACANAQPGDTLTFSITSSNPIDEQLNTVKAKLNIHIGGLN
jgi:hypothetical protein